MQERVRELRLRETDPDLTSSLGLAHLTWDRMDTYETKTDYDLAETWWVLAPCCRGGDDHGTPWC